MKIGYYPGCALHGSSNDYEQSVRACLRPLGMELDELGDWICCGATAAHSLNARLAVALPARNLGLARQQGCQELFAPVRCVPCSCSRPTRNSAARRLRRTMSEIVEVDVDDSVRVLNLIEVIQKIGLDQIQTRRRQRRWPNASPPATTAAC